MDGVWSFTGGSALRGSSRSPPPKSSWPGSVAVGRCSRQAEVGALGDEAIPGGRRELAQAVAPDFEFLWVRVAPALDPEQRAQFAAARASGREARRGRRCCRRAAAEIRERLSLPAATIAEIPARSLQGGGVLGCLLGNSPLKARNARSAQRLGVRAQGWCGGCAQTKDGGGRGIRTPETVSRLHTFQACAFNHSATPPERLL